MYMHTRRTNFEMVNRRLLVSLAPSSVFRTDRLRVDRNKCRSFGIQDRVTCTSVHVQGESRTNSFRYRPSVGDREKI